MFQKFNEENFFETFFFIILESFFWKKILKNFFFEKFLIF